MDYIIKSVDEVKKMLVPFGGGYGFSFNQETVYLTNDSRQPWTIEQVKAVLNKIPIPVDWLTQPIFLLPFTLRMWDKFWGGSYLGRAYSTHMLVGAGASAADIVHEIGHMFCFRFIDSNTQDNRDTALFKEYKTLRGIADHHDSDYYDDRPGEALAEDFRYLLGFGEWTNERVPPPGPEVAEWICKVGGFQMYNYDYDVTFEAGHGGKDPGACAFGKQEKDFNLKIALHQHEFAKKIGLRSALVRSDDETLSLNEHAERVTKSKARVCVSDHVNAGKGHGFEIIHSLRHSSKLAEMVMAELVAAGAVKRGVKTRESQTRPGQDYYRIMYTGQTETIIVEHGFIDNPDDLADLEQNWRKYAEAEVIAIAKFLGHTLPKKEAEKMSDNADKAKTSTTQYGFSDLTEHWARNMIKQAKDEGLVNGYDDGTFRPEQLPTRAEMVVFGLKLEKRIVDLVTKAMKEA